MHLSAGVGTKTIMLMGPTNANRNGPYGQMENAIEEWCLNKKYREILKHRFLDGCTYEEIAEIVDMSDRQVKRIVYKYGDAVLKHILF